LLPYILPDAVRYAIPASALLAATSVYGQFAANNELLALKSLGISPLRVLWPAVVLGGLLVPPTVWLADTADSWGYAGLQRTITDLAENILYRTLNRQHSFRTAGLEIAVKGVDDRRLLHPTLIIPGHSRRPTVTINAEAADLRADTERRRLMLRISNGKVWTRGNVSLEFVDTMVFSMRLEEASVKSFTPCYAMRDLPSAIRRQEQIVADLQSRLALDCVRRPRDSDRAVSEPPDTRAALRHARYRLFRLKCFRHRRWSQGVSCLTFILLGVSMALRLRTADWTKTFFLSFLPILIVFYPIEFMLTTNTCFPHAAVWFAHAAPLAASAWLLRHVVSH
jgi:lipopolysaccharide export system permease protein